VCFLFSSYSFRRGGWCERTATALCCSSLSEHIPRPFVSHDRHSPLLHFFSRTPADPLSFSHRFTAPPAARSVSDPFPGASSSAYPLPSSFPINTERPPLGTHHRGSVDSLTSVTSLPLLGMVRGVPVGNRGQSGGFAVFLYFPCVFAEATAGRFLFWGRKLGPVDDRRALVMGHEEV
jgi:hypothetical protein